MPACASPQRVALVAQSVPSASYVPCVTTLPAGWVAGGFVAVDGHTSFRLASDRAEGRPVLVQLVPSCVVAGATATAPRGAGVRTYTRLRSISPRYAGTLLDVFAGGCVTYRFDFPRGPHITLMEDFQSAVGLYPRQELALRVGHQLGVSFGP